MSAKFKSSIEKLKLQSTDGANGSYLNQLFLLKIVQKTEIYSQKCIHLQTIDFIYFSEKANESIKKNFTKSKLYLKYIREKM